MNKKKKIIVGIVSISICVACIVGYSVYSSSSKSVDVLQVSNLNMGYYEDPLSMSGVVSDSGEQSIMSNGTSVITEVYVTAGQNVKAGDKLLAYDIASLQLSVKMKEVEVASAQNDLDKARQDLTKLQNTDPIVPTPEPTPTPTPTATPLPEPVQTADAWDHISKMDQKYDDPDTDGSYAHPYRFIVTEDGFVTQTFFNAITETDKWLSFEIHESNTAAGDLTAVWMLQTNHLPTGSDDTYWYVYAHDQKINEVTDQDTAPETTVTTDGYTQEQLAALITKKQQEIRTLDLNLRKKQLELKQLQQDSTDGIAYAKQDGVVTVAHAVNDLPQDGSAFLTVSSGTGSHVQAYISELLLDKVKTGTAVYGQDYQSGKSYEGTVSSVSQIPADGNVSYSENANVTFYPCDIYFEQADGLSSGSYLSLNIDTSASSSNQIWLDTGYVRKDQSGYYVMKEENGKLKKQSVTVGKIAYGYLMQIKEGLSTEDYIAFPYSKNSVEGANTKHSDTSEGVMIG